jgi:hypothetical protein
MGVLLAVAILVPAARGQGRPVIRDEARLFSRAAIEEASRQIAEMRQSSHRELVVETVKGLEGLGRRRLWFLGKWQVERRVRQQARERAEQLDVDGVYALICTDPPQVQVLAWPAYEQRVFDNSDCEALRRLIVHQLQNAGGSQEQRDEALLAAVAQVRAVLRDNQADQVPPPSADNVVVAVVLIALGILAVFWLVLRVIRRRAAADVEPPELTPAVLGSLFGSPASLWIYDRLFLAYRPATPADGVAASPPPAAEVVAGEEHAGSTVGPLS